MSGSDGQTVTYSYDSSHKYLVAVKGTGGGVTAYTYDSGTDLATQNALTVIANPSGTYEFFTYNATGRLASMSAGWRLR